MHVFIVSQYTIVLHSLLHIFLLASIFDVLRHRRVSRGTTLRQLSTRLRNVRYALRSLHFDHVDVGLIETVLNFLLLGESVRSSYICRPICPNYYCSSGLKFMFSYFSFFECALLPGSL